MANYVVIARFDDKTNDKFLQLQSQLFDVGYRRNLNNWPPHITIAAYENINADSLCYWAEDYAQKHLAFKVMISALGVFPPGGEHTETAVLYAAPASSKTLIDFYYGFHDKLDEFCGDLGWWYSAKYGLPTIHSTIGTFNIADMQKAMDIVFHNGIFGEATISALEVYTYPMCLIKRYDLCEASY